MYFVFTAVTQFADGSRVVIDFNTRLDRFPVLENPKLSVSMHQGRRYRGFPNPRVCSRYEETTEH
jgi:hypothetical protein